MTVKDSIKMSFIDWKISLKLFHQNFKTLITINLIFYFVSLLISYLFFSIHIGPPKSFPPDSQEIYDIVRMLEIIIYTFMWCQYGLAHDIMSSGDYCTEGKRVIYFYKKFWAPYLVLSIIINFPNIIGSLFKFPFFMDLMIIRPVFDFIFFVLFIETFPILTSGKRFREAIKENFRVFAKTPFRIIFTWLIFYLIFQIPSFLIQNPHIWFNNVFPFEFQLDYLIFKAIMIFGLSFFGFSLMAFISTRIYNSYIIASVQKENIFNEKKMVGQL
jgi:hypothetical protein